MKLKLSELCMIDGATGNESAAAEYVMKICGGRTDNLGSVISGGGKIAACAFLDERGVFVSETGEKIRICPIGSGAKVTDLVNRRLRFSNGAVGYAVCEGDVSKAKFSDLYVACEGELSVGDVGCVSEQTIETDEFLITKAPLRAASSAVLFCLSGMDLKLMFTTLGYMGKKGLNAALFREKPEYAVVIDTIIADGKNVKCGGGAAVKMMDGSYTADSRLRGFCETHDCQRTVVKTPEIRSANSIHFGANTAVISVPVENIGGYTAKIMKSDIKKCAEFAKEFIKTLY